MPKLHLTIPADLLDKIDAAKPNFLDRKGFICLLLSSQLDKATTLGGPSEAGTPLLTSSSNTSLIDNTVANLVVNTAKKQAKIKERKPRTKGSAEFEAFWKQYLAIKHRANGQTKPAAVLEWAKVTKEITPQQLQQALSAAVTQQVRSERETGWAAPFPDCHRWLSKGYWQQYVEAAQPALAPAASRPDFTPPPEHPDAPF